MCGAVTVACAGVSVFSRPCDCSGASPTVAGEPKTQLKKNALRHLHSCSDRRCWEFREFYRRRGHLEECIYSKHAHLAHFHPNLFLLLCVLHLLRCAGDNFRGSEGGELGGGGRRSAEQEQVPLPAVHRREFHPQLKDAQRR